MIWRSGPHEMIILKNSAVSGRAGGKPGEMSRRAFTLIELVFVMVIIGIIATLVITRMDGLLPAYRLKGAGADIAGLVELAQSSAVSKGSPLGIRYDIEAGRYWIALPDEEGIIKDEVDEKEARVAEHSLGRNVRFKDIVFGYEELRENGYVTQRVSPLGAVSSVMIHLEDSRQQQLSLEILAISGQVIFYDFYKEYEKPSEEK